MCPPKRSNYSFEGQTDGVIFRVNYPLWVLLSEFREYIGNGTNGLRIRAKSILSILNFVSEKYIKIT